jgi:hypothetical protein
MAVSIVWFGFAPRSGAPDDESPAQTPSGPIACVIIDAGHGGQDSGAVQADVQEKISRSMWLCVSRGWCGQED